jgi:hypothetical protein
MERVNAELQPKNRKGPTAGGNEQRVMRDCKEGIEKTKEPGWQVIIFRNKETIPHNVSTYILLLKGLG